MARKHGHHKGLEPYQCADGKIRWRVRIAWPDGEIRRAKGLFDTIEEARDELIRLRYQLTHGPQERTDAPPPERLIAEEIIEYLATKTKHQAYRDDRQFAKWWTAFFRKERVTWLAELRPTHVNTARKQLAATGITGARINRYTDWGRAMINFAIRQGRFTQRNPFTTITRYPESPAPIHRYSEADEAALARGLGPYYADWVRFGILTNTRQREQFQLRWTDIHWEDGLILIRRPKNRQPRVIVMTAEVRTILKRLHRVNNDVLWVFPSPSKRAAANGRNFMQRVFNPIRNQLKLPLHLKWHTLRHTFGSRLAERGWNPKDIMEYGGWSDIRAAQRYIHYEQDRLRAIGESLTVRKLSSPPKKPKGQKATPSKPRKGNAPVAQLERAAVS